MARPGNPRFDNAVLARARRGDRVDHGAAYAGNRCPPTVSSLRVEPWLRDQTRLRPVNTPLSRHERCGRRADDAGLPRRRRARRTGHVAVVAVTGQRPRTLTRQRPDPAHRQPRQLLGSDRDRRGSTAPEAGPGARQVDDLETAPDRLADGRHGPHPDRARRRRHGSDRGRRARTEGGPASACSPRAPVRLGGNCGPAAGRADYCGRYPKRGSSAHASPAPPTSCGCPSGLGSPSSSSHPLGGRTKPGESATELMARLPAELRDGAPPTVPGRRRTATKFRVRLESGYAPLDVEAGHRGVPNRTAV